MAQTTQRQDIVIYDFDGTLTSADTLLAFIRYACGLRRMLLGFLYFAPLLVLMKMRLYNNGKAKERLFAHFFKDMTLTDFDKLCRRFASDCHALLRPAGVQSLDAVLRRGAVVLVVSASVDNWVRPFFMQWQTCMNGKEPQLRIVGTQIEVRDGHLTGRFTTPNCYGAEKVRRAQTAMTLSRAACHITAYGDSRGDRELLDWADESHYKPFR